MSAISGLKAAPLHGAPTFLVLERSEGFKAYFVPAPAQNLQRPAKVSEDSVGLNNRASDRRMAGTNRPESSPARHF